MSEQQTVEQIAERLREQARRLEAAYWYIPTTATDDNGLSMRQVVRHAADELRFLSALASVRRQEEEKTEGLRACQSEPVREPEATPNPTDCAAQEWQRDGRGLWAMRSCRYYAGHGKPHDFGAWRYNVKLPERQDVAQSAAPTPEEQPATPESSSASVRAEGLREAWEAGFKLAVSYGDNWVHFDGEQKERQWQAFLESRSLAQTQPREEGR